jgi:capsid protein
MKALDYIKSIFSGQEKPVVQEKPEARVYAPTIGYYGVTYNGEKNIGEIGPMKDYELDYDSISLRSWQSYLESDVTRMVIKRFVTWVIGKGLKLQSEPSMKSLETEKIIGDSQGFSEVVEARWDIWANSKVSHNNMMNLNELQKEAYKNACLGGDVLVIQRFDGKKQTIQIIDGRHVTYPYASSYDLEGKTIINGIEFDTNGEHIAYYVCLAPLKYERIPAKNSLGLRTAWLVYGDKHRIDDHRGISKIVTVLETLAKTERYKEATVGTAEEGAKIAYQIVHQPYSSGENPLLKQVAQMQDLSRSTNPATFSGEELSNKVIATTNKQAINMPLGAEAKPFNQSKATLLFKDFYITLLECVCAVVGIPPNVAMSKYDSNFSASRAALKDWEHTLEVERYEFAVQFLKPIYDFFLHVNVLTGKVQANGYLVAYANDNLYVYEAYRKARWVGANVPHIDPEKEVRAERLKLGDAGASIPLTTVERSTEMVDGGNSDANIEQFSKELEKTKKLKIEVVEQQPQQPVQNNSNQS